MTPPPAFRKPVPFPSPSFVPSSFSCLPSSLPSRPSQAGKCAAHLSVPFARKHPVVRARSAARRRAEPGASALATLDSWWSSRHFIYASERRLPAPLPSIGSAPPALPVFLFVRLVRCPQPFRLPVIDRLHPRLPSLYMRPCPGVTREVRNVYHRRCWRHTVPDSCVTVVHC